jgi:2-iminoacetate synthase ThiH
MMSETAEQREERIRRHVLEVRTRIEEDLAGTEDMLMKRIEADAATVVTLSIIKELLPNHIREHVQAIIDVHEEVWNSDGAIAPSMTPRKPLGERLLHKFSTFMRAGEGRSVHAKRLSFFARQ